MQQDVLYVSSDEEGGGGAGPPSSGAQHNPPPPWWHTPPSTGALPPHSGNIARLISLADRLGRFMDNAPPEARPRPTHSENASQAFSRPARPARPPENPPMDTQLPSLRVSRASEIHRSSRFVNSRQPPHENRRLYPLMSSNYDRPRRRNDSSRDEPNDVLDPDLVAELSDIPLEFGDVFLDEDDMMASNHYGPYRPPTPPAVSRNIPVFSMDSPWPFPSSRRVAPGDRVRFSDAILSALMLPSSLGGDSREYEFLLELGQMIGSVNRGLSQSHLDSISSLRKLAASDVENLQASQCSICICEYEVDEEVRTLPCWHLYHMECIDRWMKENRTCPICKADITVLVQQAEDVLSGAPPPPAAAAVLPSSSVPSGQAQAVSRSRSQSPVQSVLGERRFSGGSDIPQPQPSTSSHGHPDGMPFRMTSLLHEQAIPPLDINRQPPFQLREVFPREMSTSQVSNGSLPSTMSEDSERSAQASLQNEPPLRDQNPFTVMYRRLQDFRNATRAHLRERSPPRLPSEVLRRSQEAAQPQQCPPPPPPPPPRPMTAPTRVGLFDDISSSHTFTSSRIRPMAMADLQLPPAPKRRRRGSPHPRSSSSPPRNIPEPPFMSSVSHGQSTSEQVFRYRVPSPQPAPDPATSYMRAASSSSSSSSTVYNHAPCPVPVMQHQPYQATGEAWGSSSSAGQPKTPKPQNSSFRYNARSAGTEFISQMPTYASPSVRSNDCSSSPIDVHPFVAARQAFGPPPPYSSLFPSQSSSSVSHSSRGAIAQRHDSAPTPSERPVPPPPPPPPPSASPSRPPPQYRGPFNNSLLKRD